VTAAPLGRFGRFVLGGGLSTAVTWALFLVLARTMQPTSAYTLTYVVGIGLAYVINSRFVFRSALGWRTLWRYPLVYAVQYAYGLTVISILAGYLGLRNEFAITIVTITAVPITFLLTKLMLTTNAKRQRSNGC
jgi:putative flippase GtrA